MIKKSLCSRLIDIGSLASVMGIWPRFIEPRLLRTHHFTLSLPSLPEDMEGLRVLQLSDLHLGPDTSSSFLRKIVKRVENLSPDMIVFTGDFLVYSELTNKQQLSDFLASFAAPYGCYAILGNHDYAKRATINAQGDYAVTANQWSLGKVIKQFIKTPQLSGTHAPEVKDTKIHPQLLEVLSNSPFQLLHNETTAVPIHSSFLNITGLGDYSLNQVDASRAFKNYKSGYPGLILVHNPDAVRFLNSHPGDVVLCGHTHGGQVNIPWIRKKLFLLENPLYRKGLHRIQEKWVYINKGLGSALNFRFLSIPELTLITMNRRQS